MYPVGGEKKRCVKRAQVKFNGMGVGGVGYYASISMWRWYLHVFVGSYVSFGRSPSVGLLSCSVISNRKSRL